MADSVEDEAFDFDTDKYLNSNNSSKNEEQLSPSLFLKNQMEPGSIASWGSYKTVKEEVPEEPKVTDFGDSFNFDGCCFSGSFSGASSEKKQEASTRKSSALTDVDEEGEEAIEFDLNLQVA
eukprot:CAMPEP_0202965112 /NCGR_PEP_ID=MMETSP1396-20130829/9205_1 /ASSEMBLY_ACC=CAM_ASM_000872 /TAXON_ID= /ORGANISM="Pseudokeronopsis sp., Strain Brazil" /LENGTH=121 /DNA_ID=CAMNT_0049687735 /DNA_START=161 /DNA_END=526 /DNA_ORIENTATION=+